MRSLCILDSDREACVLIGEQVNKRRSPSSGPTPQKPRDPSLQTPHSRTRFSGTVSATSQPTCPRPEPQQEQPQPGCDASTSFGSPIAWRASWARPNPASGLAVALRPQIWLLLGTHLLTTLQLVGLTEHFRCPRPWAAKPAGTPPGSALRSAAIWLGRAP